MPTPVICAVARTPIGKYRGALGGFRATELGSMVVEELMRRAGIEPASGIVDELIFGQVLQAGAGQAPARQVALGAGLPAATPCVTINKVCGSSLKAVMIAASAIRAGEYEVVVAGGMESMTNAPHFATKISRDEYSDLQSIMIHDGLLDAYDGSHMGLTGENVANECDISRAESDALAQRSHQRAHTAWENGWLDWETFPVAGLTRDEGVRQDTTVAGLAELAPVFDSSGQVTAGNASQISDGASAVLVASRARAEREGWPILATIIDQTTSGLEPARVMSAPIPAVNTLLERNGLTIDDVDLFEHNEAFASATCAVSKTLNIPQEKINVHGGAVAIGHPLGATGTRILMTLISALRRTEGKTGIATICLGGGNAVALLIEVE